MDTTLHEDDARDVRALFDRALLAEPSMHLDITAAAQHGRSLRRRRTARQAMTAAGMAMLLAVALVAIQRGGDIGDEPDIATGEVALPAGVLTSAGGPPVATHPEPPTTDAGRELAAAIEANSPAGWTFELGEVAVQGGDATWVEGIADDGTGPGRISVFVDRDPGGLPARPCADDLFRQGGDCTETVLADGSVLAVRGLTDADTTSVELAPTPGRILQTEGLEAVAVGLVRPDGSAVVAESGNFSQGQYSETTTTTTPDGGPVLSPTRTHPTYTAEQLADLVRAVANAID